MTTSPAAGLSQYEIEVVKDVMVPMRDGVRLATDLYLPRRIEGGEPGRVPALLTRTPYNKEGTAPIAPEDKSIPDEPSPGATPETVSRLARFFAGHGYAVVVQDVAAASGPRASGTCSIDDGRDGVDTCAWIGGQPWSNGKVGTFGTSYVGGTQHAIAMAQAPELATVDPGRRDVEPRLRRACATAAPSSCASGTGSSPAAARQRAAASARLRARPALLEMMDATAAMYLSNLPLRRGTTPLKHAPSTRTGWSRPWSTAPDDAFWDAEQHPRPRRTATRTCRSTSSAAGTTRGRGNTTANYQRPDQGDQGPAST